MACGVGIVLAGVADVVAVLVVARSDCFTVEQGAACAVGYA